MSWLTNVKEKLKDFYYKMEDKYYAFLDKLDKKIHVYKIIDPIEAKGIRTFPIVLGIAAILLILIVWGIIALLVPNVTQYEVTVLDYYTEEGILESWVHFEYDEGRSSTITDADGFADMQLPQDRELDMIIEAEGYQSYQTIIGPLVTDLDSTIVYLYRSPTPKTISFMTANGLVTDDLSVSWSCEEIDYTDTVTASYGSIVITPPEGCTHIRLTVNDTTFTLDSGNLSEYVDMTAEDSTVTIDLAGTEPTGAVNIYIQDEDGFAVPNLSVTLSNSTTYEYETEITDSSGLASFDVGAGTYFMTTYDSSNIYSSYDSRNELSTTDQYKTLNAGSTMSWYVIVGKEIRGTLVINVKDLYTLDPVEGATLRLELNDEVPTTQTSNAAGQASFNLSTTGTFDLTVEHPNYLVETKEITVSESDLLASAVVEEEILLEEISEGNFVNATVRVKNEFDSPLGGATVILRDSENKRINTLITNDLGEAVFHNLKAGTYTAQAYTSSAVGESIPTAVSPQYRENIIFVEMNVGKGTLEVIVKDEDGEPVKLARVQVFSGLNDSVMTVEDDLTSLEGYFSEQITAGQKIHVYVAKPEEGFIAYTSVPKEIIKDSTTRYDVVLEKEVTPPIETEYLGLYQGDTQVGGSEIILGSSYTARFAVKVPRNTFYGRIGLHVRTGPDTSQTFESDEIYIGKLNAASRTMIKGETYSPGIGYSNEIATAGDAKWGDIIWKHVSEGTYIAEIEIKTRELPIDDPLELHYRAWARKGDSYFRDPPDPVSGDSLDSAGQQALYAATKIIILKPGAGSNCIANPDRFCYTVKVEDKDTGLETVGSTQLVNLNGDYTLSFALTKQSTLPLAQAELRISNPTRTVPLSNYAIQGGSSNPLFRDYNANILIGDLVEGSTIIGSVDFTPQEDGENIPINLSIVSAKKIQFSVDVILIVDASKTIEVELTPRTFASGIDVNWSLTATDSVTGQELQNALVKVKYNPTQSYFTDREGKASGLVPIQSPGSKVTFTVSKAGYQTVDLVKTVTSELLEVIPNPIEETVNTKTDGKSVTLSLINRSGFDLSLDDLTITNVKGSITSYIDFDWEEDYLGIDLEQDEHEQIIMLLSVTDTGKTITKAKTLEGTLDIMARNTVAGTTGRTWTTKIPIIIKLGLGEETSTPNCLEIIPEKEFISVPTDQPQTIGFELYNNCAVDDVPIALTNLEAKIDWPGTRIGQFRIILFEPGSSSPVLGRSYRTIRDTIEPNAEYSGEIEFTLVNSSVYGTFSPILTVRANNRTSTGDDYQTEEIDLTIDASNFRDCLTINEGKTDVMVFYGSSEEIKIDNACDVPINVRFKSDLTITPVSVQVPANESEKVKVESGTNLGVFEADVYTKNISALADEARFTTLNISVVTIDSYVIGQQCLRLNSSFFVTDSRLGQQPTGALGQTRNLTNFLGAGLGIGRLGQVVNRCYNTGVKVSIMGMPQQNAGAYNAGGFGAGYIPTGPGFYNPGTTGYYNQNPGQYWPQGSAMSQQPGMGWPGPGMGYAGMGFTGQLYGAGGQLFFENNPMLMAQVYGGGPSYRQINQEVVNFRVVNGMDPRSAFGGIMGSWAQNRQMSWQNQTQSYSMGAIAMGALGFAQIDNPVLKSFIYSALFLIQLNDNLVVSYWAQPSATGDPVQGFQKFPVTVLDIGLLQDLMFLFRQEVFDEQGNCKPKYAQLCGKAKKDEQDRATATAQATTTCDCPGGNVQIQCSAFATATATVTLDGQACNCPNIQQNCNPPPGQGQNITLTQPTHTCTASSQACANAAGNNISCTGTACATATATVQTCTTCTPVSYKPRPPAAPVTTPIAKSEQACNQKEGVKCDTSTQECKATPITITPAFPSPFVCCPKGKCITKPGLKPPPPTPPEEIIVDPEFRAPWNPRETMLDGSLGQDCYDTGEGKAPTATLTGEEVLPHIDWFIGALPETDDFKKENTWKFELKQDKVKKDDQEIGGDWKAYYEVGSLKNALAKLKAEKFFESVQAEQGTTSAEFMVALDKVVLNEEIRDQKPISKPNFIVKNTGDTKISNATLTVTLTKKDVTSTSKYSFTFTNLEKDKYWGQEINLGSGSIDFEKDIIVAGTINNKNISETKLASQRTATASQAQETGTIASFAEPAAGTIEVILTQPANFTIKNNTNKDISLTLKASWTCKKDSEEKPGAYTTNPAITVNANESETITARRTMCDISYTPKDLKVRLESNTQGITIGEPSTKTMEIKDNTMVSFEAKGTTAYTTSEETQIIGKTGAWSSAVKKEALNHVFVALKKQSFKPYDATAGPGTTKVNGIIVKGETYAASATTQINIPNDLYLIERKADGGKTNIVLTQYSDAHQSKLMQSYSITDLKKAENEKGIAIVPAEDALNKALNDIRTNKFYMFDDLSEVMHNVVGAEGIKVDESIGDFFIDYSPAITSKDDSKEVYEKTSSGTVVSIDFSGEKIVYSPSYATPILMMMHNQDQDPNEEITKGIGKATDYYMVAFNTVYTSSVNKRTLTSYKYVVENKSDGLLKWAPFCASASLGGKDFDGSTLEKDLKADKLLKRNIEWNSPLSQKYIGKIKCNTSALPGANNFDQQYGFYYGTNTNDADNGDLGLVTILYAPQYTQDKDKEGNLELYPATTMLREQCDQGAEDNKDDVELYSPDKSSSKFKTQALDSEGTNSIIVINPKPREDILSPDSDITREALAKKGDGGGQNIKSMLDVLELVKTEKMCLKKKGSNYSFYWNTNYIVDPIREKVTSCKLGNYNFGKWPAIQENWMEKRERERKKEEDRRAEELKGKDPEDLRNDCKAKNGHVCKETDYCAEKEDMAMPEGEVCCKQECNKDRKCTEAQGELCPAAECTKENTLTQKPTHNDAYVCCKKGECNKKVEPPPVKSQWQPADSYCGTEKGWTLLTTRGKDKSKYTTTYITRIPPKVTGLTKENWAKYQCQKVQSTTQPDEPTCFRAQAYVDKANSATGSLREKYGCLGDYTVRCCAPGTGTVVSAPGAPGRTGTGGRAGGPAGVNGTLHLNGSYIDDPLHTSNFSDADIVDGTEIPIANGQGKIPRNRTTLDDGETPSPEGNGDPLDSSIPASWTFSDGTNVRGSVADNGIRRYTHPKTGEVIEVKIKISDNPENPYTVTAVQKKPPKKRTGTPTTPTAAPGAPTTTPLWRDTGLGAGWCLTDACRKRNPTW